PYDNSGRGREGREIVLTMLFITRDGAVALPIPTRIHWMLSADIRRFAHEERLHYRTPPNTTDMTRKLKPSTALANPFLLVMSVAVQAQQREDPVELDQKAHELQAVGKYAEAIAYARRALEIEERRSGASHPNVGILLNNLSVLYNSQGRFNDAEPLLKRSL